MVFSSCDQEEIDRRSGGKLSLYLTDAPIDQDGVTGVYITFTGVEVNKDGTWESLVEFEEPKTINLLDYQSGKKHFIGEFQAKPGEYRGLRFSLDVANQGETVSQPVSYIELNAEKREPLFIPSNSANAFTTSGRFTVPSNGLIDVVADFDVRKSITQSDNGRYFLRPTLRVIVDHQVGDIEGKILGTVNPQDYFLYAYEVGRFSPSETELNSDGIRFPRGINSTRLGTDESFKLAFLPQEIYDIVIVRAPGGKFQAIERFHANVNVRRNNVTSLEIDLSK